MFAVLKSYTNNLFHLHVTKSELSSADFEIHPQTHTCMYVPSCVHSFCFVKCGCVYVLVFLCVGVLVICVLVFTVFCIVCTVFLYCFVYVYFLFCSY